MPETKLPPVEATAQATIDHFRDAVNGKGTIAEVLKQIDDDRKMFSANPEKESAYTERVRAKLHKEGLLPEVSLTYAKENIADMAYNKRQADNPNDLKVNDDSMKKFRVAEYKHMTDVEKAMNHYLMGKSDDIRKEGLMCNGALGGGDYFNLKKLDGMLNKQKSTHTEDSLNKSYATSMVDQLAKDNGKLLKLLTDQEQGGITKDLIEQYRLGIPGVRNHLNRDDRLAMWKLEEKFDEIADGDDAVSVLELKYWAEKNGADASKLKRNGF